MHVGPLMLVLTGLFGLSACAAAQTASRRPPVAASVVSAAAPGSASYLLGRPACGVGAGGTVAYFSMNTEGSDMEVVCRSSCTVARSDGGSTRFSGRFFLPAGVSDTHLLEQSDISGGIRDPATFTAVSEASASCEAR